MMRAKAAARARALAVVCLSHRSTVAIRPSSRLTLALDPARHVGTRPQASYVLPAQSVARRGDRIEELHMAASRASQQVCIADQVAGPGNASRCAAMITTSTG